LTYTHSIDDNKQHTRQPRATGGVDVPACDAGETAKKKTREKQIFCFMIALALISSYHISCAARWRKKIST
jgi:hypothetical protein